MEDAEPEEVQGNASVDGRDGRLCKENQLQHQMEVAKHVRKLAMDGVAI